MNKKSNTYELLARYFAGDITELEASSLKNHLSSSNLKSDFSQIEDFWNLGAGDQYTSSRITRRTLRKISLRNVRNFQHNFLSYAAVVAFIFALPYGLYSWGKHYPVEQTEYASHAGEVNQFELPDGSKVWLNAKSKITYTQYLIGSGRHLSLDGEAYFHVVSDPDNPFFVSTSDAQIKVTGTKFAISAYHDDPFVTTHLEEGVVTFISKTSDIAHELKPGQLVRLDKQSKSLELNTPKNVEAAAWRSGELNFYDESLDRIAKTLERRFDVDIQFANDSMKELRYSAEFEQESLEQILNFIQLASALEIKQQTNNTYIVSQKNNAAYE